jgi:papilin
MKMLIITIISLFILSLATSQLIPNRDVCQLAPISGQCRGYFIKYFYNATNGKCEQFIWTGCDGNLNRFDSELECTSKCKPYPQTQPIIPSGDACQMPPEGGRCRGYFVKYFYNTASEKCEQFIWSGCDGNLNRFDSELECTSKCKPIRQNEGICAQQVDSGPCFAYLEKYFYNTTSGKCEKFVYGGCGGSLNRFESKNSCEMICRVDNNQEELSTSCSMQFDSGPCRGAFRRYFFNSFTNKCEMFWYGGCLGNKNNFMSENDCYAKCVAIKRN